MKTNTSNFIKKAILLCSAFLFVTLMSCKDDEPGPDPVASFQYEISEDNYLEVTFTNYSLNASSYSWNFGDGETSTEENPVHVYAEPANYEVVLTATNDDGVNHSYSETIEIKDPNEALALLAGETSKTWKLYRVETSMGVGPDAEGARTWWALENNGSRPCVYFHEFTFNRDGEFIFNDNGSFWGEEAVFGEDLAATCFEAIASNMVNSEGDDVSAWLSGTHAYEYNPSNSTVTLIGLGAWMGLPQLTTDGDQITPVASKSFQITIEEHEGFDLMIVSYTFEELYWDFSYASYSDPSLEPDVVTEEEEWGEDLEDLTPDELYHTFESETSFAHIGAIGGTSIITVGEDDPAGEETKVGMFERVAGEQWQEAQLRTTPDLFDIQFDNFTVAKIDIYIPDDTDFADGGLQRFFVFGFADMSQTQEWWNSPVQFVVEGDDVVLGEWETYEFDLTDVKERDDLDMIFLGIGGGGHDVGATFYIRNLIFE